MARKVILLMRTATPGRYSPERVFADVRDALPPGIDAKIVRVPFDSRGVVRRLLVTTGHENVESFLPKVVAARYADVYRSMELPS